MMPGALTQLMDVLEGRRSNISVGPFSIGDRGGTHSFHHNKSLPSFGDRGGALAWAMAGPKGGRSMDSLVSDIFGFGDQGGKKYINNFQRHFENLRSMGAVPDNLKGDRGGRYGISSSIPPDYGDRGGKMICPYIKCAPSHKTQVSHHGGCNKCVKKTPQEMRPPAFGPRRPPFRPYKFTPRPRPHHSIRHTLGDDGGVFNRMASVPFYGPRRYTLN